MKTRLMNQMKQMKNSKLGIAIGINLLFMVFAIGFCGSKYEVSDDFVMDSILSGAYSGQYNEHILFINAILGWILKIWYMILPKVSWYFVGGIMLCYVSFVGITYLLLDKLGKRWGIIISIILISFFSDDVYILPQFTKTASLLVMAGGEMMLYGLFYSKGCKKRLTIPGAILAVTGSMIRLSCIYYCGVFLLISLVLYIVDNRKKGIELIKKLCACLIVIGICFLLSLADDWIYQSNPEYQEYREYSTARAYAMDVSGPEYSEMQDEMLAIGVTGTDYDMLQYWNFSDTEYYTKEKLTQIGEIVRNYQSQKDLKSYLKEIKARKYYQYTVFWCCAVLSLLLIINRPKRSVVLIPIGLTGIAFLLYLSYIGRMVYRVEYGFFLSAAISIALAMEYQKRLFSKNVVCILVGCALVGAKIPLYVVDYGNVEDEQQYRQNIYDALKLSGVYNVKKYLTNVNNRNPYENLIRRMENDDEHYYLLEFVSTIQLIYYEYEPWVRMPANYYDHYMYMTGVTTMFPDVNQKMEEKNITNIMKDIVNDDIYLVDNVSSDLILGYLHAHYYPNARKELVDTVDGFEIWKIYKE